MLLKKLKTCRRATTKQNKASLTGAYAGMQEHGVTSSIVMAMEDYQKSLHTRYQYYITAPNREDLQYYGFTFLWNVSDSKQ